MDEKPGKRITFEVQANKISNKKREKINNLKISVVCDLESWEEMTQLFHRVVLLLDF